LVKCTVAFDLITVLCDNFIRTKEKCNIIVRGYYNLDLISASRDANAFLIVVFKGIHP